MNADPSSSPSADESPRVESESLVGPFLDGELPPGEARRVEALLEESPELRNLARQYRSLDDLARDAFRDVPRVSAEEWGAMWESIQRETGPASHPLRRLGDWIIPVCSVAALLLLGLYLGQLILSDPVGPPPAEPETTQIPVIEEDDFNSVDFSG